MKKWICIILCLGLCGCGHKGKSLDPGNFVPYDVSVSPEQQRLQLNLARWYNVNLRSQCPDAEFEACYNSILYFENGLVGYLELVNERQMFPISHRIGEGIFYLSPDSAFPVGGTGDCTVLCIDQSISLRDGDSFILHILDNTYVYQIGEEGTSWCILQCGEAIYRGALLVED